MGSVDLPAENVDFLAQYEQLDVVAYLRIASSGGHQQYTSTTRADSAQNFACSEGLCGRKLASKMTLGLYIASCQRTSIAAPPSRRDQPRSPGGGASASQRLSLMTSLARSGICRAGARREPSVLFPAPGAPVIRTTCRSTAPSSPRELHRSKRRQSASPAPENHVATSRSERLRSAPAEERGRVRKWKGQRHRSPCRGQDHPSRTSGSASGATTRKGASGVT